MRVKSGEGSRVSAASWSMQARLSVYPDSAATTRAETKRASSAVTLVSRAAPTPFAEARGEEEISNPARPLDARRRYIDHWTAPCWTWAWLSALQLNSSGGVPFALSRGLAKRILARGGRAGDKDQQGGDVGRRVWPWGAGRAGRRGQLTVK